VESTPSISVIVPARDAAQTLGRTLESLYAQRLDHDYEVIVVDDGSRDDTAAIARRHEPLVRLVGNEGKQGAGSARNRGVEAARAPVLAFIDADCFPTPRWLAEALDAIGDADLVQGAVRPDPSVPRTPFDRSLFVERDRSFYQTANLVVRRELFDSVGGFRDWTLERSGWWRFSADGPRRNATHRPVGEDTLFGWMACRQGARTAFAPKALVHHAVVPGGVRDAIADRWHWTRDMPGLAQLVPELRDGTFYRRWFFGDWTAQFDLAVAGLAITAVTRQKLWLISIVPYVDRVRREAAMYRDGRGSRLSGLRRAMVHALGAPAVDAATLTGLLVGSIAWRSLVL
jgi:glycosyltransferase involved in cell wall biosynthesis